MTHFTEGILLHSTREHPFLLNLCTNCIIITFLPSLMMLQIFQRCNLC
uniref:Uncharacterized protein n=1 Tax=Salix viminalis TaxID=40686 RepID=A0A6N2MI54_SALVM